MMVRVKCPGCNEWVTIEHFGLFKATLTREINLQIIRPSRCDKCKYPFAKPIIEWQVYFRE